MDTIFLSEIKVEATLGVPAWERLTSQTVILDIEIALPHSRACQSDAIEDTIDYGVVVARVRETLADTSFRLVEALAEHVCQLILTQFNTPRVKVKVAKPSVLPGVKALGVTIEREAK